ncbi:hypothetical protein CsatB_029087 [Cannabis sativa]
MSLLSTLATLVLFLCFPSCCHSSFPRPSRLDSFFWRQHYDVFKKFWYGLMRLSKLSSSLIWNSNSISV